MDYMKYKKPLRMEEEEEPSLPENPMEKMIATAQFDKKFIEQRKVFLWGVVDDRSAKEITARLLFLDAVDPNKEIKFYINSPGGVVTSGMVIYDTMQMISSPVSTICMGMAASMGSILLSGGKKRQALHLSPWRGDDPSAERRWTGHICRFGDHGGANEKGQESWCQDPC
jgi:ATP-dependent Clp protease protease subunit